MQIPVKTLALQCNNMNDEIILIIENCYKRILQSIEKYTIYAIEQVNTYSISHGDILMPITLIFEQVQEQYNNIIFNNNIDDMNENILKEEYMDNNIINTILISNTMRLSLLEILYSSVYAILGKQNHFQSTIEQDTDNSSDVSNKGYHLDERTDWYFRSISKLLYKTIGKKVTNKMFKNRSETIK
jgi:hypothetical protein